MLAFSLGSILPSRQRVGLPPSPSPDFLQVFVYVADAIEEPADTVYRVLRRGLFLDEQSLRGRCDLYFRILVEIELVSQSFRDGELAVGALLE